MDEHAPIVESAPIVTRTPWWRIRIPGVALTTLCLLSVFALAYYVLDKRINELNSTLRGVEMSLGYFHKRMWVTDTIQKYQPKAEALGFQDPDIKIVSVVEDTSVLYQR